MTLKMPRMADTATIRRLNTRIERLDVHNTEEMFSIGNVLNHCWLTRTMPRELTEALVTKFTAIMDGSWYGDEPEEYTIRRYI